MRQVIVNYRVKPDRVAENQALVRGVYEELDRDAPEATRYAAFQLEDGVSFVHVARFESEEAEREFSERPAFQAFQRDIRERCDEPPVVTPAKSVGAYRAFHSA